MESTKTTQTAAERAAAREGLKAGPTVPQADEPANDEGDGTATSDEFGAVMEEVLKGRAQHEKKLFVGHCRPYHLKAMRELIKLIKEYGYRDETKDALQKALDAIVECVLAKVAKDEDAGEQHVDGEQPTVGEAEEDLGSDLKRLAVRFFDWFTVDEILGSIGLMALLTSKVPGVSEIASQRRDQFEKDIANAAWEVMRKGRVTSLECEDAEDGARIMFVADLLRACAKNEEKQANRVAGSPESVAQATEEAYNELRMVGVYSPAIQKAVLLRYITEDLPTAIREELENEEALFGEHGIFTEHLEGDGPVDEEAETCFDAVVKWLRSQSKEAKLTAVVMSVLLSHEHVLPGKNIGNDLYREFEAESLASDEGDFDFIAAYTAGMMAVPC